MLLDKAQVAAVVDRFVADYGLQYFLGGRNVYLLANGDHLWIDTEPLEPESMADDAHVLALVESPDHYQFGEYYNPFRDTAESVDPDVAAEVLAEILQRGWACETRKLPHSLINRLRAGGLSALMDYEQAYEMYEYVTSEDEDELHRDAVDAYQVADVIARVAADRFTWDHFAREEFVSALIEAAAEG